MSRTYENVFSHVNKARLNVLYRQKSHDRDMNNQQIFNLIDGWVGYYNEAWNKYTKRISA